MNPLDYVPGKLKSQLIDRGLSKLADAAERSGSTKLASTLRNLRSDTPFIEDVTASLGRALTSFEQAWRPQDEQLTEIVMADLQLWCSTDFLGSVAAFLLHPTDESGPEVLHMKTILAEVVAGRVADDRVAAGHRALLAAVRDEMFAHPKLRDMHSLYLQKAMVTGQATMLETLEAIRQGIVSIEKASQSRLNGAPAPPVLEAAAQPTLNPAPGPSGPAPTRTINLVIQPTVSPLPDVLTPSLNGHRLIVPAYTPAVGTETAQWLSEVQLRVTDTIERADFVAQQEIAEQLLSADLGIADLRASAYYLLGEAKRLQADFSSENVRHELLESAADAYGAAVELNGSIRATRGLGRVQEIRGDISGALRLYSQARVSALLAYTVGDGTMNSEAAHEVLRSTRHYVACAAQASADSLTGAPVRHNQIVQLRGAIAESQELHYSILPEFSANNRWMQIEWFMGLVLLARAYIVVGDHYQSWLCLAHALNARMEMMSPARQHLSTVELGNLRWWLRAARAVKSPLQDFGSQLEMLGSVLESGDTSTVWSIMEEIAWPVRSPWLIRQKEK